MGCRGSEVRIFSPRPLRPKENQGLAPGPEKPAVTCHERAFSWALMCFQSVSNRRRSLPLALPSPDSRVPRSPGRSPLSGRTVQPAASVGTPSESSGIPRTVACRPCPPAIRGVDRPPLRDHFLQQSHESEEGEQGERESAEVANQRGPENRERAPLQGCGGHSHAQEEHQAGQGAAPPWQCQERVKVRGPRAESAAGHGRGSSSATGSSASPRLRFGCVRVPILWQSTTPPANHAGAALTWHR